MTGYSMIILAGGRSSRMGTDKADLLLQGKTFLETQIAKGRELGITDILVSGYHGKQCSAKVIPDRIAAKGPLGGLEACLRAAKHPRALVLSVDVPLVPTAELRNLVEYDRSMPDLFHKEPNEKYDDSLQKYVTILQNNGKEQPLIAVYDCSLADEMEQEILTRKGSVFAFINRIGYRRYESSADAVYFENINDTDTYKKHRCFLENITDLTKKD